MPAPLHLPQIAYLIKAYRAGATTKQIADELGVSLGTVYARLRRHQVPIRSSRHSLPVDTLVSLYASGISENALAARYGVSRPVIRRRLAEAHVTIRDPLAANRLMMRGRSGEENRRNTEAAHRASRGRHPSLEERMKVARGRQRTGAGASPTEGRLAAMLLDRGIATIAQQAIGPYNCDLGAAPVAVEIFGGDWHWHGRHLLRTPERFRYILNAGWHIIVIHVTIRRHPLTAEAADDVAAFIQQARRDPAARREYRMIRGTGEFVTAGSFDDDPSAIIPTLRRSKHAGSGN